jgi:pyridoxal phosphate enzyme (YggS family)
LRPSQRRNRAGGESRPQQLWEKAAALDGLPIRWHFVGHLQRNKVQRTLPLATLVHSADSARLIAAVDQSAAALGRCVPLLLEVNISREPAKHGFVPGTLEAFLGELPKYPHVEVRGLMCLASLEGGRDAARRDFAALRQYRDRLRDLCPAGVTLPELSMGMSGDFTVAIEEGATIVRVGSSLFEGVAP